MQDAASQKRLGRLLLAVGALGLLMMPVEYRGGASLSHPHALYQFWIEAANGTLDHHDSGPGGHHRADGEDVNPAPVGPSEGPTASGLMQPGAWLFALSAAAAFLLALPRGDAPRATWVSPVRVGRRPAPAVPPP